jgi:hypothetical protein
LGGAETALDDDEVVDFTQNSGWQKVDSLVPLLYCFDGWFRSNCEDWISAVREISDHLKVRHSSSRRGTLWHQFLLYFQDRKPETAAVLSALAKKWGRDSYWWERKYLKGLGFR